MAIKLTYEFVKEQFDKKGWKLFETKYIHSKFHMACICPKGHIGTKTYRDLRQNRGCSACCNRAPITLHKVKKEFAKVGYKVLTDCYVSSSTKFEYSCSEGHKHSMSWDAFREGVRCQRCYEESRKGETNPNWRGGASFGPYCPVWSDKGYKADIKERDGNICQNPYCFKTDNKLVIHHIDYDKKNCHPNNLITVCNTCNSRANKDRGWHTGWYQTLMNKKYGYNYE